MSQSAVTQSLLANTMRWRNKLLLDWLRAITSLSGRCITAQIGVYMGVEPLKSLFDNMGFVRSYTVEQAQWDLTRT